MKTHTVWHKTKRRLGAPMKNGRRRPIEVLVSADVPGLLVQVGPRFDLEHAGRSVPLYTGSQVITAQTGHTIGPVFYGADAGCAFAAAIAPAHDWTTFNGTRAVEASVSAAIVAALTPIATENGAAYHAFLAEHRAQEEAEQAVFAVTPPAPPALTSAQVPA